MTQRLKGRPGVFFAFVFIWVFSFLFSPLIHYHPQTVHAHDGHASEHSHDAHIHSPELHQLAHAFALHPADHDHHGEHAHSCPCEGPASEHQKVDLDKDGLKPEFLLKAKKLPALHEPPSHFKYASAESSFSQARPYASAVFLSRPQERSPPVSLV